METPVKRENAMSEQVDRFCDELRNRLPSGWLFVLLVA
jgi:hypothetical protein